MQSSPFPATELPPAPDSVEDAVMNLMMALGRRVRQRQPGDTVDFSAIPVLKVLSHRGAMRLSALAHVLDLDASTVSRHARQLEERGLLERTDDPDDGRASRVAISEHGQECLAAVFETRRQIITHSLDGLSSRERDTLRDLLHRLVLNLSTQETSA
jgi:DNA-binding MarR family transcriptional regulator